jgi:hypothetical protein
VKILKLQIKPCLLALTILIRNSFSLFLLIIIILSKEKTEKAPQLRFLKIMSLIMLEAFRIVIILLGMHFSP